MADHRGSSEHHETPHSFWQRPFVQRRLPFLASLMMHVGIVVIGIILLKAIPPLIHTPPPFTPVDPIGIELPPADPSIPKAPPFVHPDGKNPGSPTDGIWETPPTSPRSPVIREVIDFSKSSDISIGGQKRSLMPSDDETPTLNVPIGGPHHKGIFQRPGGPGNGTGSGGPGIGTGGGSDFPPPTIVFVCDATGSMLDKFDQLRHQMNVEIAQLNPAQKYSIIFFQQQSEEHAGDLIAMDKELLRATPEIKQCSAKFLDSVNPRGGTDPIPALKAALEMHPAVIWFLADSGDFADRPAVLRLCAQLNAGHQTKINTIAFLDDPKGDNSFLEQLAKDNGGFYELIEAKDLQN